MKISGHKDPAVKDPKKKYRNEMLQLFPNNS